MIRTEKLTVVYGKLVAVRGLDLEVPKGEIFGLIGPNGAGKSSTLRALATLQEPTWGRASIGGFDVDRDRRRVHSLIGFMPDSFILYDDLDVSQYLEYFARAHRVPRNQRSRTIREVIELTDLQVKSNEMVGSLSRGMKQRLKNKLTPLRQKIQKPTINRMPHIRILMPRPAHVRQMLLRPSPRYPHVRRCLY